MKRISILVPEAAMMTAIDDPRHLLAWVNEFHQSSGKPPVFDIRLVGLSREVELNDHSYVVRTDASLRDATRADFIFIPAFEGDAQEFLTLNRDFVPWLVEQYRAGAEIASLCVGSFLLAATGLLDGRKGSTHWQAADEFKRLFPAVDLVTDKIITAERGIYTSGGALSYWNLLLHLIEKFTNRDTAIRAAKTFQIDASRNRQAPFVIFRGQRAHGDETIIKVQDFLEKNYRNKTTVEQLAGKFALSRRSLERRFKGATGNTVPEYLQRVRVEIAKKLLETSRRTVAEIAVAVGYTDLKTFRTVFKKIAGIAPAAHRVAYDKLR